MVLKNIESSVNYILNKTNIKPRVSLTLGSGLSHFVEEVEVEAELNFADIPGFVSPKVAGHPGKLVFGHVGKTPVAVLQGRIHYYEGHSAEEVVHPTRVLAKLGVESMVITNAAGGLTTELAPGSFVLLRDHINLMGYNPLRGKNYDELGPRFPDMSEPYSKELSNKLEAIMQSQGVDFVNGVYCGVSGPSYETASEVRMLGTLGGTCVGMSTVPEVIAASHMGVKCVGVSCVTNLGTGLSDAPLDHSEVKEVAQKVEGQFCSFLKEYVSTL